MDTYRRKNIYVRGRGGGVEIDETSAFSHEEEGVQIGMNCNTPWKSNKTELKFRFARAFLIKLFSAKMF